MNTTIQNLFTTFLITTMVVSALGLTQTAQAADDMPRIKITINELTASPKSGMIFPRRTRERPAVRLKITPVETEDGHIRVIVPIEDLSEGFNVISVPARILEPRDVRTGGIIQPR